MQQVGRRDRNSIESLEDRTLLAADFGDAPDTSAGAGVGNYQTLQSDDGASHTIDATQNTLFLGNSVDGDDGTLQNATANADDVDGTLPDDEDGVLSPVDLRGTIGAAPTITLLATNTTGSAATLAGWIDYNSDGVFENATERAQITVPDATTDERFTLTFPTIPPGSTGTTYARFRLSTDSAASSPTGSASDGEVEDYRFSITAPGDGTSDSFLKIASNTNGGPALADGDNFGASITSIGDLDGDGVDDLAVGAFGDDGGAMYGYRGAVHVLLMNSDRTVKSSTKIGHNLNGGPDLEDVANLAFFGKGVAGLGDLDGDGVPDLAVGARGHNFSGAVYILLLNSDGTAKSLTRIGDQQNGGPDLGNYDYFGSSVASLGDMDGDGVTDLAVGAIFDDTGGDTRGAVHVLFLNSDGTVKSTTKIASETNGGPVLLDNGRFGSAVANLGDLDGDGVVDLAVGARTDNPGGGGNYDEPGAVYLLLMNSDGSVKSSAKIASEINGGPTLGNYDNFGSGVAGLGDLDGDGIVDLAVGAYDDSLNGASRGTLHILLLNTDGSVKSSQRIDDNSGGGPGLNDEDQFGAAVANLGDVNGDGITDLAVGATGDKTGDSGAFAGLGAVYTLLLDSAGPSLDYGDAPDTEAGTGTGNYQTTEADGGPSHEIVTGLRLGANVDGEHGTLQNVTANADDVDGALPDDEDGVLDPLDLHGTEGAVPTITLLVTNTTGSSARLTGWIDYNQDGVFTSFERAAVLVPDGSINQPFTLTFPAILGSSTGTTYARFRLSTDDAGLLATGAASDGEVEDYTFSITAPSTGVVKSQVKISNDLGGLAAGTLDVADEFGSAVASLGDLDGDGVSDIAVGARRDQNTDTEEGAVYVLLMNSDGTVKSQVKISDGLGGLTAGSLGPSDKFGAAVAGLGDLDGDGVPDMAVGAFGTVGNSGGSEGAVYVLLLNSDGTVKSQQRINDSAGGLTPSLEGGDLFGTGVAGLGDLDGDGVPDMAVGAQGDENGDFSEGAVYVLMMNSDGTVKSQVKISDGLGGLAADSLDAGDNFGSAVATIGDLDGDGVTDLAVGAQRDGNTVNAQGAVYVLLMNSDGTVKSQVKISDGLSGMADGSLGNGDNFGNAVAGPGDLDGDGVPDMVVGALNDENDADSSGTRLDGSEGAVYVLLLLTSDGTVKSHTKISDDLGGLADESLDIGDNFGSAVAGLGDLDGDGVPDIAVGAIADENDAITQYGGSYISGGGAVYILNFAARPQVDFGDAPDAAAGTGPGNYETTEASDGPRHDVVAGLFLGDTVDGFEDGTLQNARANADDVDRALPDDEDGVLNPLDLLGTVGAAPTITLLATNTTGSAATLYGWIDYNQDGVFDNSTERASVTVPDNTTDGLFTLMFPTIPSGSTGTTYARFRLSTDTAAQDSTGAAGDGEVEDYTFAITAPGSGLPLSTVEINFSTPNGPSLVAGNRFGYALASLGDFNGDGINDLAAASYSDDNLHLLFLSADGSVKQTVEIDRITPNDRFGESVTSLGDLNGDGVSISPWGPSVTTTVVARCICCF